MKGIDPFSSAYEAGAHPSTPHNLILGYSMEFESMLTESQSVVLTADTNYTISKHTAHRSYDAVGYAQNLRSFLNSVFRYGPCLSRDVTPNADVCGKE